MELGLEKDPRGVPIPERMGGGNIESCGDTGDVLISTLAVAVVEDLVPALAAGTKYDLKDFMLGSSVSIQDYHRSFSSRSVVRSGGYSAWGGD